MYLSRDLRKKVNHLYGSLNSLACNGDQTPFFENRKKLFAPFEDEARKHSFEIEINGKLCAKQTSTTTA
jgi:hypothetical protein